MGQIQGWQNAGVGGEGRGAGLPSTLIVIRIKNQCLKLQLLIQGISKPEDCFGQQNWTGKSLENSCLIRFPLPAASSPTENTSGTAFPVVVLALLPPDGAHKCRSAQKSNVLGGELIKCFQTSKKKKKMKQSVQVEFKFWGQASGTPETLL